VTVLAPNAHALAAVPLAVDHVSFKLRLAGAIVPWANYERLSRTGSIYEPLLTACLTHVLRDAAKPRFMDIGAYLGYFACYASALLGKDAEVCAIESNPIFAAAIEESARLNEFSQLTVFQAALSDLVEPVRIDGLAVVPGGEVNNAMTITLDDLCQRHDLHPTVVKIDVHGADGKVRCSLNSTALSCCSATRLALRGPLHSTRSKMRASRFTTWRDMRITGKRRSLTA
jgi:FkbM family methyltransferase